MLSALESGRASALAKIEVIHLVGQDCPVAKGMKPFQDVSFLFSIRNYVVHTKPFELINPKESAPQGVVYNLHPIVRGLSERSLLPALMSNLAYPPHQVLCTPELAEWCCNTALSAQRWIAEIAPDSLLRPMVDHLHGHPQGPEN